MNKNITITLFAAVFTLAIGLVIGSISAPKSVPPQSQPQPIVIDRGEMQPIVIEDKRALYVPPTPEPVVKEQPLGGLVNVGRRDFPDGLFTPAFNFGGHLTESWNASTTIAASEICDYAVMTITPLTAETEFTATLDSVGNLTNRCLTKIGDVVSLAITNGSTSASNLTVAAGTGMDLQEPDGQNVIVTGGNWAFLDIVKLTDTTAVVTVDETTAAD